jgi:hypothetical protein
MICSMQGKFSVSAFELQNCKYSFTESPYILCSVIPCSMITVIVDLVLFVLLAEDYMFALMFGATCISYS